MKVQQRFRGGVACLLYAGFLLLPGCSGDGGGSGMPTLGEVRGIVMLDGKPLEKARVEFVPTHARMSAGTTDEEGKYTLSYDEAHPGAAVGQHTVKILTKIRPMDDTEKVPATYNTETTLKRKVIEGDNEMNFDLKSK